MAIVSQTPSVSEVKTALAETSNSVGGLCTSKKINKWSKKKPVIQPRVSNDGLQDWWKAFDGKCGLTVPVYTSAGSITAVGSFLYDLKNKNTNWNYAKPYGGVASPYRLGDFRGYEHSAIMPIGSLPEYDTFVDIGNKIQIDLEEVVEYPNSYNLTLQDITHQGVSMREYYLGALLYKSNSNYLISTTTNKINSGNLSIVFENMQNQAGVWSVAFFMCSVALVQGGTLPVANYIPIDLPHSEVIVSASGGSVTIDTYGMWNKTNNTITYEYNLFNSGGSPKTVTGIQCVLVRTTGSQTPQEGAIIQTQTKPNETIQGNSIVSRFDNVFTHNRIAGGNYWVGTSAVGIPMTYNQVEEDDSM